MGELERLHGRFVHRFSRSEPRESALAYMQGLVAPLERKNGWTAGRRSNEQAAIRGFQPTRWPPQAAGAITVAPATHEGVQRAR